MKVAAQLKEIAERRAARSIFSGRDTERQPLSLLEAIYFDRTDQAKAIIEADPAQINQQDPFAGLTPLHVAIFRQNVEVVRALCGHPRTDLDLKDVFARGAVDMCVYTRNDEMVKMVIERAYSRTLPILGEAAITMLRPLHR